MLTLRHLLTLGVDYFGPFEVKLLRRTIKKMVLPFNLSLHSGGAHRSCAFAGLQNLAWPTITKFIARRGRRKTFLSDNGSNFAGYARELKQYIDNWNKTQIAERLQQQDIEWSFNPPGAPHFGGV